MVQVDYLLGLDLGRNRDYSTLAVVEQTRRLDRANPAVSRYAVRHLRRWPLKTSYTAVVADLVEVVRRPPLCQPALVVDQTGVGQAVVDCLLGAQIAATVVPVMITGGRRRSRTEGAQWWVPKKELVLCLQGLLQSQRLQIAT